MPRPIVDICNNPLGVRAGERYGIEVEGEGCPYERSGELDWSAAFQKFWATTSDGSLRNGGIEFVSKPLTRLQVPSAVDALWQYFSAGRVQASVRTGVHIHASCLGLNTDDVVRILQHYALLEPLLFAVAGAEREENIYCIPWYRALDEPEEIRGWLNAAAGLDMRPVRRRGPCKYSALFVGPLTRYGTIEFRHAPTWTTAQLMHRWFSLVQAVWATHETEYNVLEEWRRVGPVEFARRVAPFDWLPVVTESDYEAADVEHVASLLEPPVPVITPEWGRAPELRGPGTIRGVPLPSRDRRPETAAIDRERARRIMAAIGRTTTPTLTVNGGPETPATYGVEEESNPVYGEDEPDWDAELEDEWNDDDDADENEQPEEF